MRKLFRLIVIQLVCFLVGVQNSVNAFEYSDGWSSTPDIELHLEVLDTLRSNINVTKDINITKENSNIAIKEENYPIYCGNEYKYSEYNNKIQKKSPKHKEVKDSVSTTSYPQTAISDNNIHSGNKIQEPILSKDNSTDHSKSVNAPSSSKVTPPMTVVTPEQNSSVNVNNNSSKVENNKGSAIAPTTSNPVILSGDIQTQNNQDKGNIPLSTNTIPMSNNSPSVNDNKVINNSKANNQSSMPISPTLPTPPIAPIPPSKTNDNKESAIVFPKPLLAPGPVINPNIGNKSYKINFNGGTNLSKEIEKELNIIANNLRDNSTSILKIIGYVKEDNAQSAKAETRSASLKRVIAIRNYLVRQGISTTRLVVQAGIISNDSLYNEVEIQEIAKANL